MYAKSWFLPCPLVRSAVIWTCWPTDTRDSGLPKLSTTAGFETGALSRSGAVVLVSGAVAALTVTVNDSDAKLPDWSVAEQTTVVSPMGKNDPGDGMQ